MTGVADTADGDRSRLPVGRHDDAGPRHAGGLHSFGTAINDSGQVTGCADTAGDGTVHAFLWDGTTMLDLGTLGGTFSDGVAINASGQVTGGAVTADGAESRLPVGRHDDAGPRHAGGHV